MADVDYIQMIKDAIVARREAKKKGKVPGRGRSKSPNKSRASGSQSASTDAGDRRSGSAQRHVTISAEDLERRNLGTIDLAGQGMTSLPPSVFNRREKPVGELDVSSNNIRVLPPDVQRLNHLVVLDLSRNGLRCNHANDFGGIPPEISMLTSLEVLSMAECNLPFIPPSVWKIKNLRYLDISRNRINILFPEVGNLMHLRHLNAQQTGITTLPPEIALCQELEELLLWGNVIDSLPETMREMPKLKLLAINHRSFANLVDSYMENLLKKGQIQSEHIPNVLFNIPRLDTLDLSETKINNLPESCRAQIKEFNISKNYFHVIPPLLTTMTSLVTLDLAHNVIKELPASLGQLASLTSLVVDENELQALPDSLRDVTGLRLLSVSGNQLTSLPGALCELRALRTLRAARNRLQRLPALLYQLTALETLDLTANQLTELPITMHRMTSLRAAHTYQKLEKYGLWLHQNPLKVPPAEVWKTDNPENIYRYLKQLEIRRTENLQRQKLILLGASQSGKTSLQRTLVTGKSSLTRPGVDATHLVDFVKWSTANKVPFLTYDLGGDEVYKVMFPLLCDAHALYLIVYDHRKYREQLHFEAIGYWLELLYMHVPGAAVKVVGTQCDQCNEDFVIKNLELVENQLAKQLEAHDTKLRLEIGRLTKMTSDPAAFDLSEVKVTQLHQKLERLKQLLATPLRVDERVALVTAAEGVQGMASLVSELELMVVNQNLFPHAQRKISPWWSRVKEKLKQLPGHYIDLTFAKVTIQEHGVKSDDVTDLLHYLHDTGEILWLSKSATLCDVIFHRPRHLVALIKALYRHDMATYLSFHDNRVFSSRGFEEDTFTEAREQMLNQGSASRDLLHCLWFYLKLSRDEFYDLLDMMERLDLCYVIPEPELPARREEFEALVEIPWYNQDSDLVSLSEYWPASPSPGTRELAVHMTFPFQYPVGLFERLSSRVQRDVITRTDWQDVVTAETSHGILYIGRQLDPVNFDCVLSLKVRGNYVSQLRRLLEQVGVHLRHLLHLYPGLVWYSSWDQHGCVVGDLEATFPPDLPN